MLNSILLEKSKLARQQFEAYKALLIQSDQLNAHILKTEQQLENIITSNQLSFDKVSSLIVQQENYLAMLTSELYQWDSKPLPSSPTPINTLRTLSIPLNTTPLNTTPISTPITPVNTLRTLSIPLNTTPTNTTPISTTDTNTTDSTDTDTSPISTTDTDTDTDTDSINSSTLVSTPQKGPKYYEGRKWFTSVIEGIAYPTWKNKFSNFKFAAIVDFIEKLDIFDALMTQRDLVSKCGDQFTEEQLITLEEKLTQRALLSSSSSSITTQKHTIYLDDPFAPVINPEVKTPTPTPIPTPIKEELKITPVTLSKKELEAQNIKDLTRLARFKTLSGYIFCPGEPLSELEFNHILLFRSSINDISELLADFSDIFNEAQLSALSQKLTSLKMPHLNDDNLPF